MAGATRTALLIVAAGLVLPAACLFPSYTFDEPEPTGSGGATTEGGGGGTTSSTGGAGGTIGPVEDCFNGQDDDDDGAADCADDDCAPDAECVEPIPVGWGTIGYVALAQEPTEEPCPAVMPVTEYVGHGGLSAGAAACTPCGCDPPAGQACELVTDLDPPKAGLQPMRTRNTACGTSATAFRTLTVPDMWTGVCYQSDTSPGGQTCNTNPCNVSVESSLPVVSGGACTPNGGVASLPEATWAITAKACSVRANTAAGCSEAQVCLPRPPAPFAPRICIGKAGDVACPGTTFTERYVFHAEVEDTRDCTACSCGLASGGTCQITISLYSDPQLGTCTTPVTSFTAGTCLDLPGNNPDVFGREATITSPPSGGSCPVAGGGTATGSVAPKTPTTFCCLP